MRQARQTVFKISQTLNERMCETVTTVGLVGRPRFTVRQKRKQTVQVEMMLYYMLIS